MTAQSVVSLPRPATQLARWSAAGLIGLLSSAALLVAWRRLAGALSAAAAGRARRRRYGDGSHGGGGPAWVARRDCEPGVIR